jgi:undecaprenyl-diphosphatase
MREKSPFRLYSLAFLVILAPQLQAENIDHYVSRRIREDLSSPCMDKVMTGFSSIGSNRVALGVVAGLYTLGDERLQESTKLATFSVGGAAVTCVVLKYIVNRERPTGTTNRYNTSFPSSHAAGAFAFSYVMGSRYPRTAIPLYLTASTICFSRVYLGRHYVSDVVAGSILGIIAGWIVMKNEDSLLKVHF